MAALAPLTAKLRLVASVAPILIHPAIVAKMAVTLDEVSGGRLGVNIVSSDHEFVRMGLYPSDFESFRHDYIDEWLRVMKQLWTGESVAFEGKYFNLTGYSSNPTPVQKPWPTIVYATDSEGGFRFVAKHCDEAFVRCGPERNHTSKKIKQMARDQGRTVKTQAHVTLIQGDSDEDAERIVEGFRDGADLEAICNVYDTWFRGDRVRRGAEILEQSGSVRPVFYQTFPLVGGPRRIADFIEDMAVNGDFDGILFSFPNYIEGLTRFNEQVMPLLEQRGLRAPD
jgi:pyrimidine oxygenase